LEDNHLIELPADLSKYLFHIQNLNLNGMDFSNFMAVVTSLTTMPQLKSLYITLNEEDQVDLIMRWLPDLEFLNGLPVERDDLIGEGSLGAGDEEGSLKDRSTSRLRHEPVNEIPEVDDEHLTSSSDEDLQRHSSSCSPGIEPDSSNGTDISRTKDALDPTEVS